MLRTLDVEIDPATVAATFERAQLRSFIFPAPAAAMAHSQSILFWRNFHVKVNEVPVHVYRAPFAASACLRGPGVVIVGPLPSGNEQPALADVFAGYRVMHSRYDAGSGEASIAFAPLPNNTAPPKGSDAMTSAVVRLHSHADALTLLRERDSIAVRHPDGSTRVTRVVLSPLSVPSPPLL